MLLGASGQRNHTQARGGVLTSTGDVERWKEHFEELINPVDMLSLQETQPEISSPSLRLLHSGKAAEVEMIWLALLDALEKVGGYMAKCL